MCCVESSHARMHRELAEHEILESTVENEERVDTASSLPLMCIPNEATKGRDGANAVQAWMEPAEVTQV